MSLPIISLSSLNTHYKRLGFGAKQRSELYASLGLLLSNHVSMFNALSTLVDIYSDRGKRPRQALALIAQDMQDSLSNGDSFSHGLKKWIPYEEHCVLEAGELCDQLQPALKRAAELVEAKGKIRAAVFGAVSYPIILVLMLGVLLGIIAKKLMPELTLIVPESQWTALIKFLGVISSVVNTAGIYILIAVVVLSIAIIFSLPRLTGRFRLFLDKFPPWSIYRALHGSTFLLSIGVLMASGMNIPTALGRLGSHADAWLKERIDAALLGTQGGLSLGEALEESGHNFPDKRGVRFLSVISNLKGADSSIEQFGHQWLLESSKSLEKTASIIRSVLLCLIGVLLVLIVMAIASVTSAVGGAH